MLLGWTDCASMRLLGLVGPAARAVDCISWGWSSWLGLASPGMGAFGGLERAAGAVEGICPD